MYVILKSVIFVIIIKVHKKTILIIKMNVTYNNNNVIYI